MEGFARGGKLLLANIVNGFSGVEPIQLYGLLEFIPVLERFKLIDKKTAQEVIRCEIDTHCYEMLIGRNFNYRKFDGSTIFNIPEYQKYLQRSTEKDTDKNLGKFYKDNIYSFFIMHGLLPNIKIYFDTFPDLKVIHIRRNPVDLFYSWHKRNLPGRFGKDPKIFMIPIKGKKGPVPWYAYRFKDKYHTISENDRFVLCFSELFRMNKNSYDKLPLRFKNQILFVSYEELVFHKTNTVVKSIGKFLKRAPLPEMESILKRENAPRNAAHNKKCRTLEERFMCSECKLREIKKVLSGKYLNILMGLKKKYEDGKIY